MKFIKKLNDSENYLHYLFSHKNRKYSIVYYYGDTIALFNDTYMSPNRMPYTVGTQNLIKLFVDTYKIMILEDCLEGFPLALYLRNVYM